MEHATTASGLDKLIHSITGYLGKHPPPIADLDISTEAADKLGNQRLMEQCHTAKERCQVGYKNRESDPPENCHLTVKKIAKNLTFFSKKLPKMFFFF